MLCEQQIAFGARFAELLIELVQRAAQGVHLMPMLGDLPRIVVGELGEALKPFERGAGQVVLALVHRQFRLPHPIGGGVLMIGSYISGYVGYTRVKKCQQAIDAYEHRAGIPPS